MAHQTTANATVPALHPSLLRTEYRIDPAGLDEPLPRLSWILEPTSDNTRGHRQTAYQITAARSLEGLTNGGSDLLFDTDKVASAQNVLVDWPGEPLVAGDRIHWRVRSWDEADSATEWSDPAFFSIGPLETLDWAGAEWIANPTNNDVPTGWNPPDVINPDPYLRRTVNLAEQPTLATAWISSVGYHEMFVNGQRVTEDVLVPNVSDLNNRALYREYDLTPLLQTGENEILVHLGTSWSIFDDYDTPDKPLLKGRFDFHLPDESVETLVTDSAWETTLSANTLLGKWHFRWYGGERQEPSAEAGILAGTWESAVAVPFNITLSADIAEPNRRIMEFLPVEVQARGAGTWRVDFGRTFTGFVEVPVKGEPHATVEFDFSELSSSTQTWDSRAELILDENGEGTFSHRFNYVAARYMTVRNISEAPTEAKAWLVTTSYDRAGWFSSSDAVLNSLYDTFIYTFDCLSLGAYLVDCPHRERMGYGGDALNTLEPGLDNHHMGAFFTKWFRDWQDVQREDGFIAHTAPTYWGGGGPAWSGYVIELAWQMYQTYGDTRLLERALPVMEGWLGYLEVNLDEGDILRPWGGKWDFLGDWVWPEAPGAEENSASEYTLFFNNAVAVRSFDLVADICEVLGEAAKATTYRNRAEDIRQAAHAMFFNAEDNSYVTGQQAYMAMALLADIPPENLRAAVWERFETEILVNTNGHVDAGITGIWAVLTLLREYQRDDLISSLVLYPEEPGWRSMIERGDGVYWEKWDGNGSRLHSSYLAMGSWFIEGPGGIRGLSAFPGWSEFALTPALLPDLAQTSARYDSPHGTIATSWEVQGHDLHLEAVVPPNTNATLHLPTLSPGAVEEGGLPAPEALGLTYQGHDGTNAIYRLSSGTYQFVAPFHDLRHPFLEIEPDAQTGLKMTRLGALDDSLYPWIWSPTQGFWYVVALGADEAWIYDLDPQLGWCYAGASFPWIYSSILGEWLYVWPTTLDGQRFLYRVNEDEWLVLGPSGG